MVRCVVFRSIKFAIEITFFYLHHREYVSSCLKGAAESQWLRQWTSWSWTQRTWVQLQLAPIWLIGGSRMGIWPTLLPCTGMSPTLVGTSIPSPLTRESVSLNSDLHWSELIRIRVAMLVSFSLALIQGQGCSCLAEVCTLKSSCFPIRTTENEANGHQ